jgi:hypothetical protein
MQISQPESGMLSQPFQLQAIRQKDLNYTAKHGEDMNEERKSARSKADFIRLAGIGPELAEFVTEFIEKPEIFYSIPVERRREIENQMDAVLLSFGRLC